MHRKGPHSGLTVNYQELTIPVPNGTPVAHGSPAMDALRQDLRYGIRVLRKDFAFTATVVVMLALGIGINAAIFSVFAHVLLAPLQFPDEGSLYVVSSHASGPDFRDYRDQNTVFSGVAAVIPHFSEVWTGDGEPRVVNCAAATADFFNVMGIRPVLGRVFVPGEFHDLRNGTVLVSWKFWKGELGGDPHVIGRVLRIEDVGSTVVGVLPPMPDLYSDVDVWAKLTTEPSWPYMNWRANKFLDVIGRLKPGTSRGVAEQQLTAILRRGDGEPADVRVRLTPLKEFIVGPVTRQLNIIMAAVGLVLLVTCLNTAAILLARSVKRVPELAIRLGLGASPLRIRQQLLVEALLLSTAGGVLGLGLASSTVGFIRRVPGLVLPRLEGLHLNFAAVAVSAAVVLLTAGTLAFLSASVLLGQDLTAAFRGGRTETGRAQRRPFSALIIAEVASAVVLTVCAGLLLRSFIRVHSVDLGFEPQRVLSAYLRTNYNDPKGYVFWTSVLSAAGSVPGATSSAISDCMPSFRANAATLVFAGRRNDPDHPPSSEGCWISTDYFRTLGVPLLHGRTFSDRDDARAPAVVVINDAAARRFFPGEDPVGKQIAVNYLALGSRITGPARMREIVGVVSNIRQRALDLPPEPAIYLPYTQDETFHVLNSMNMYVRSAPGMDPAALANGLRTQIQSMYPNQPVERIQALPEVVGRSIARRTYSVGLMTAFAVLALLLCGLGIYGVVSYVTQQRTREFGIRMALGATRQHVVRNVLGQAGVLVAAGTMIGVAVSILAMPLLSQFLFETSAFDPAAFCSAVLLLAVIGILAGVVPGIRASRLDPRTALSMD